MAYYKITTNKKGELVETISIQVAKDCIQKQSITPTV